MKKIIALFLALTIVLTMGLSLASCEQKNEKKSVAFVTFGLGNDFFQTLAEEFVKQFEEAGWEAMYANGEFNPAKQIEAVENYIAMGVDAIVIWPVAPEAMTSVIEKAMAQGIKVVSFVNPTEKSNASMGVDNVILADDCMRLAAKWIDEHYADAPDHSVPVAVFTTRADTANVEQADEMLKIEQFSKKAKFVKEIGCGEESVAVGQEKMENLFTTNPEIKVFLTPHSPIALGIDAYFTGVGSPVTDYSDYAIFCVNGTQALDKIASSVEGKSPFRGTVMTGNEADTARDMVEVVTGLMDGTLPDGYKQVAETVYAYGTSITAGKLPE